MTIQKLCIDHDGLYCDDRDKRKKNFGDWNVFYISVFLNIECKVSSILYTRLLVNALMRESTDGLEWEDWIVSFQCMDCIVLWFKIGASLWYLWFDWISISQSWMLILSRVCRLLSMAKLKGLWIKIDSSQRFTLLDMVLNLAWLLVFERCQMVGWCEIGYEVFLEIRFCDIQSKIVWIEMG